MDRCASGQDLIDTAPGRTFVARLLRQCARTTPRASVTEFLRSRSMVELTSAAQHAVSNYLYGAGLKEALVFDPRSVEFVAMAEAIAAELASPRRETFTTPQRHAGHVQTLTQPLVTNRKGASETLPAGALWTATPLAGDIDTWTRCRETRTETTMYELHFDPADVQVVRIDSAVDWVALLERHSSNTSGTLLPNWELISTHFGAVHLSLSGLLTAHPSLSAADTSTASEGYRHSKSGPWAGVGDWSTVSTAWMTLPRDGTWIEISKSRIPRPR